jgi:glycosyltransferase involved in cell wall biosynthesis
MHKSDLKFIEAAAHGAAVLAAPITYESSIQHGRTGLIFRSIEEFSAHLDRLIRDAPFREQIGENARRYVTEHRLLSQHFRTRYEWYKSLVGRLDELNAELKDRVPEIFVKPSRKQVK